MKIETDDMYCFTVDYHRKSHKQGYIKPINDYKSIKTIDLFYIDLYLCNKFHINRT